jgi:anti-anti-sigma factor
MTGGQRVSEALAVSSAERQGVTVVTAMGDIDVDSAESLREVLFAAVDKAGVAVPHVVVDCAGVHFCDSVGLNVFLLAWRRAERLGVVIRLAGVRPAVTRVFQLTGASAAFSFHADADEAVAAAGVPTIRPA